MNIITATDSYIEFFYNPDPAVGEQMIPDGDWRFLLVASYLAEGEDRPRGRVANTVTDLVGLVAGDYDMIEAADGDTAFLARYYAAREIAGEVQATYAAQGVEAGVELDDPALDVAWQDKNVAVEDGIDWDGQVPLVLVRCDYEPFTERPLPTGAVVFVDPTTERQFVESLTILGFAHFGENDNATD